MEILEALNPINQTTLPQKYWKTKNLDLFSRPVHWEKQLDLKIISFDLLIIFLK